MSAKRNFEQVLATPFAYLLEATDQEETNPPPARVGDRCPRCGEANLDYDGLLNLHCPRCDYMLAGCFT
jgi:hypothetical protein